MIASALTIWVGREQERIWRQKTLSAPCSEAEFEFFLELSMDFLEVVVEEASVPVPLVCLRECVPVSP